MRPHIELFWWQLNKNATPHEFLTYRRLLNCNVCPRGCNYVKNIEHIVVSCVELIPIIKNLNLWGFVVPVFYSLDECNKFLEKLATFNPFVRNMYYSTVFYSQKSRNNIKHGGKEDGSVFVLANAINFDIASYTYNFYSKNWGVNELYQLSHSFCHPPPPEWIKVNIDASLLISNKACIGGVFRDSKG